jgi:hypothetical protein
MTDVDDLIMLSGPVPRPDDLITLSGPVPRHRLSIWYEQMAEHHRTPPEGAQGPTHPKWQPGDDDLAYRVLSRSNPASRKLWTALIGSSTDHRLTGDDLNAAVGMAGRSRNALLSQMSRSCHARDVNRGGAWQWDSTTNTYWMEPPERDLFEEALGRLSTGPHTSGTDGA